MNIGYDESWSGVDDFDYYKSFEDTLKKIFWMKNDAEAEKRIMFLDSFPYKVYQHPLHAFNKRGSALCLKKNRLDDRGCPIDSVKNIQLQYAGYFTILEIGDVFDRGNTVVPWKNDEGQVFLFKKLICMKQGSKEKPGMLINIKKKVISYLKDFGYKLAGSVWDIGRYGNMAETCGNRYTFVERIPEEEWMDYLVNKYGASDKLNLNPFNLDQMVRGGLTIPYEELQRMTGQRPKSQSQNTSGTGQRVEGASYDGSDNSGGNRSNDGPPDSAYDEAYETRGGKSNTAYVPPDDDSDIPF